MELINCPVCGSDKYVFVSKKRYPDSEYHIVRCKNCDFYYTNPEPSQNELLEFYDSEYLGNHTNVWHQYEDKLNKEIAELLINEGIKSNLDLGSGQGRFVNILSNYGIESVGVEPVKDSCSIAKEKYGLELHNKTCEQYLIECNRKFNSVTMLNVLEHLPNPSNILKLTNKCLINGGKLIIIVPNVDFTIFLGRIRGLIGFKDKYMLESKKFSQQGFDPPIHLSSFNKNSLVKLLVKNNFEIIKMTNAPVIKSSLLMSAFKNSVFLIGKLIEIFTLNKTVFGYSLLSISKTKD